MILLCLASLAGGIATGTGTAIAFGPLAGLLSAPIGGSLLGAAAAAWLATGPKASDGSDSRDGVLRVLA